MLSYLIKPQGDNILNKTFEIRHNIQKAFKKDKEPQGFKKNNSIR